MRHRREPDKAAHFQIVGAQLNLRTMQLVHAFNLQRVRADAADVRTHGREDARQILDADAVAASDGAESLTPADPVLQLATPACRRVKEPR